MSCYVLTTYNPYIHTITIAIVKQKLVLHPTDSHKTLVVAAPMRIKCPWYYSGRHYIFTVSCCQCTQQARCVAGRSAWRCFPSNNLLPVYRWSTICLFFSSSQSMLQRGYYVKSPSVFLMDHWLCVCGVESNVTFHLNGILRQQSFESVCSDHLY